MSHLRVEAEGLEKAAASERVQYYAPLVSSGPVSAGRRLLDVGCGNGYSIPEWRRLGFGVVGVDLDLYRLSRWVEEHPAGTPLVLADAGHLPFRRGAFHCVVSSGMIEHVGVAESPNPYKIRALPGRDESRFRVVRELLSVAAPDGQVLVDCPNGMFPVDFWHGDRVGAFRLHSIPDVLLPSFQDFLAWGRNGGFSVSLVPVGRRLRFRQVGRHWWGRLFTAPMRAFLSVLDWLVSCGVTVLPGRLSPFLVVRLGKAAMDPRDAAPPAVA
jgi:SAM-dependent methyltransferase